MSTMTFLDREKPKRWLWLACLVLAGVVIVLAVVYRQLRTSRPDVVWWQAIDHNLDREMVFITIDTCRGYLHQADCSPGDLSGLSLIGRSFATGSHYHQLHNHLVDRMVAPDRQPQLAEFQQANQIETWSLVFDIEIDPDVAGYFRFRLESVPDRPRLANELAEADLISDDQLALLTRGWQRYDQLPLADSGNDYWLDWVGATLPFVYGQLEFQPRQALVDQLRQQGVYRVDFDQVGQPPEIEPPVYEYSLKFDCQRLFEFWPAYADSLDRPEAEAGLFSPDRCDGPVATDSADRFYDRGLTVRVEIDQPRIIELGQHHPEFFIRQTLSRPDLASPWDVPPDDSAPVGNFDDQIGRLLPPHDSS